MTTLHIAHRRLFSQQLLGAKLETPNDVVSWLGAVPGSGLRRRQVGARDARAQARRTRMLNRLSRQGLSCARTCCDRPGISSRRPTFAGS
jgi:hypothetical protein